MAKLRNNVFTLTGIVGYNPTVPILNLTTDQREVIVAAAAANVVTIYYAKTNVCQTLHSHSHEISAIQCDRSGRFLLTVDSHCCIVWDRKIIDQPTEIRLLTLAHTDRPILCTAISDDGKYIVVATEKELALWSWCTFKTQPDGQYTLPEMGNIKSIRFRPNQSDCFVVTMHDGLAFVQYRNEQLFARSPKLIAGARCMHDSCFVESWPRGITVTDQGTAIVWQDEHAKAPDFDVSIEHIVMLKMLTLGKHPFTSIASADGVIMIADDSGELRFYGPRLRILFWTKCLQSDFVFSVSFNLNARKYRLQTGCVDGTTNESSDEIETISLDSVPRDSTFERNPFVIRKFVASTRTGKIFVCDMVHSKAQHILFTASSQIETFDAHPLQKIICGGALNGRLFLQDLNKQMTITDQNVSKFTSTNVATWNDECQRSCAVTVIRYSPSGEHLLCAVGDGYIWMLDPNVALPIRLMCFSKNEIKDIQFSIGSSMFAYYDVENTVVLCEFQQNKWQIVGKHCVHLLPIMVLTFAVNDTRLVTCGDDRFTTQYDVDQSLIERTLVVLRCSRNEQTSQIHCGIPFGHNRILTTGSHNKFKLWDTALMDLRYTFVGPYTDGIMKHMLVVGDASSQRSDGSSFLIYATDNKVMGLHLLPMDGNMFKYQGMTCHPRSIKKLVMLSDKQHVLTLGHASYSIFVWNIDASVVVDQYGASGTGLSAFCKALPGGHRGWLFQQMLNVFYYLQILAGNQDAVTEHSVNDRLAIADVPHFMRALGYFATEFEMDNLLKEITMNRPNDSTVTFDQLVRLYVNHRPCFGFSKEKIEAAVTKCAQSAVVDSEEALRHPKDQVLLDRDHLITVCTTNGEPMSRIEMVKCLTILLSNEQIDPILLAKHSDAMAERYIQKIAEVFSVKDFMHEVLGLDTDE